MSTNEIKVLEGEWVGLPFMYAYFVLAFLLGVYWVFKSDIKHKFEIFILAFYLMTGNLNKLLTFAIPGVSFFEIQPERFLFLMFSFFLLRRAFFSGQPIITKKFWVIPWFLLVLIAFALFKITSLVSHSNNIETNDIIIKSLHVITILVVIFSLRLMYTPGLLKILGKAVLVAAVMTCIVSFIQMGVDPLFMRIGDVRKAFGNVIRANGIYSAEYFSSYFLIIASTWALAYIKDSWKKYSLICLYAAGILMTFHRMSWLAFFVVLAIHFLIIAKPAFDKLLLAGLSGAVVLLLVFMVFQREIVTSTLVKERVTDQVDSRLGYYNMVFDNIGKKPLLGYGNNNNEVYYYSMLRITGMRDRATGKTGGIHNGYLTVLFYYGIPAFILFAIFIASVIFYFGGLFLRTRQIFYSIVFFLAIVYAMANMTNSLLFSDYLGFHLAIYIGLGLGLKRYGEELKPKPFVQPVFNSLTKTTVA